MPRKLGQHFLIDGRAVRKIVSVLGLSQDETVIEIGAGRGEMTRQLVEKSKNVIAIEKDSSLVNQLKRSFGGNDSLEIVHGDALLLVQKIADEIKRPYKLVGNIPYYITGWLFRVLGEIKNKPIRTVFTIQKEVAERISAKPPKMNLLAATVQIWARPEIVCCLGKESFRPPPKVESAVIKLDLGPERLDETELNSYFKLVRALFKQPRKTLLNNLKSSVFSSSQDPETLLKKAGIEPGLRPQNLSTENVRSLQKFLI